MSKILEAKMGAYDCTVGEFLESCLVELIESNEGFSGKRPLGDSGWATDMGLALVDAGLIEGYHNKEDGEYDFEHSVADKLVIVAIKQLFTEERTK